LFCWFEYYTTQHYNKIILSLIISDLSICVAFCVEAHAHNHRSRNNDGTIICVACRRMSYHPSKPLCCVYGICTTVSGWWTLLTSNVMCKLDEGELEHCKPIKDLQLYFVNFMTPLNFVIHPVFHAHYA
jgi:hypothetical protein